MRFDSKIGKAVCFVALYLSSLPSMAHAEGYLIVNSKITLTKEEVKDVFLGEKQLLSRTRLIPIDNLAEQDEFLSKFLELRKVKYEALWAKKSFGFALPLPVTKNNDTDTIETVKNTEGAVGYIKSRPPEGVTVVGKFGDSK